MKLLDLTQMRWNKLYYVVLIYRLFEEETQSHPPEPSWA